MPISCTETSGFNDASKRKRRVLFLSMDLNPHGGGEVVAAWMLQALAPDFDVTILTWTPPDFGSLDRKFGTSLAGLTFKIQTPSAVERWLVSRIPDDSQHQRANYLLRLLKLNRQSFDVVIACSSMEADLGRPGIQYIHYPYLGRNSRKLTIPGDAPLFSRVHGFLSGRTRPWMLISGYSFARMRTNLTLTNSEWTRGEIRRLFEMDSEVLYPPAEGELFGIPWERRENGFVSIGRLYEAKRQDWIIETLAQVHREEPTLRLHICGSLPSPGYLERLQRLAAGHGPWVEIHENLPKTDLLTLAGRQRYGIHAFVDEHFGIAPAEMARAGCIPFVHDSGGQVEIVDGDDRLCYATQADAVAKILAVIRDPTLQHELHSVVRKRSERFSADAFVRNLRDRVEKFIASQKT